MDKEKNKVVIIDMPVLFKHYLIKVDKLHILEDDVYLEDIAEFIYDVFQLARKFILDLEKPTPTSYIYDLMAKSNLVYLVVGYDPIYSQDEIKQRKAEFAYIIDKMMREFTKFIAEFNYADRDLTILNFSESTITIKLDMSK